MEGDYGIWMGQPVILRVATGNMRVPLRGRMISETHDSVRFRLEENWDVEIFKSMVIAVEHDLPVNVLN
jgi:hypothetical protein